MKFMTWKYEIFENEPTFLGSVGFLENSMEIAINT